MQRKSLLTILTVVCMLITAVLTSCSKDGGKMTPDDLVDKKIAIIRGSDISDIAQTLSERGCELSEYGTVEEIAGALLAGEADCAVIDRNIADAFTKKTGGYVLSDVPAGTGTLRFSVPRNKKIYSIMLNKALAALSENGTLGEIVNGYLGDSSYRYNYAETRDGSNGEFTIALDTSLAPYYTVKDGNPDGLAVQVIDAVCTYLGCDYTILAADTSAIAKALADGEADFAIGAFDRMEETYGKSAFTDSDPVLEYDYIIMSVLK